MKKITIAICIILYAGMSYHVVKGQKQMKYSVLAIEYIGISDKPILPIVISDSNNGAEWFRTDILRRDQHKPTYIHVVKTTILKELFLRVESFRLNAPKGQDILSGSPNTVRVTVAKSQKMERFVLDSKKADLMLEALIKAGKIEDSLRSDLLLFKEMHESYSKF
jgi:hypothetical protein